MNANLTLWRLLAILAPIGLPPSFALGQESGQRHVLAASSNTVRALAFAPDGTTLATGGYDHVLRLWDVETGRLRGELHGHVDRIESIAFAPDGRSLASAGLDGVKVWDSTARTEIAAIAAGKALAVIFAADGAELFTGGMGDGSVTTWRLPTPSRIGRLDGLPDDDEVLALARSADGLTLAVSSRDEETEFSFDGQVIRSGRGSTITLWDLTRGQEPQVVRRIEGLTGVVWALSFAPDGKVLAAATESKDVRLWSLPDGVELPPLRGHRQTVHGIAFSPDGRLLASGSLDRTVRLWDVAKWELLATFSGHTNAVKCLAFSPDSSTPASGSWDNTARIWDVAARPAPPSPRAAIRVPRPATAEGVARAIESMGGVVGRNAKLPDRPIIRASFRGTDLTDADLAGLALPTLHSLRSLDLAETSITDAGLAHIRGLSNLEILDLRQTDVTDAGLTQVAPLLGLKAISLSRGVGDAGLATLTGLPGLTVLNLTETTVSDAGLGGLSGHAGLKTLMLPSRIGGPAIARLKAELPGLSVTQ